MFKNSPPLPPPPKVEHQSLLENPVYDATSVLSFHLKMAQAIASPRFCRRCASGESGEKALAAFLRTGPSCSAWPIGW